MMQIKDPIHCYIALDGMYAAIVNTPEFQRLRSVEQGSFRTVYPGARHDRFTHSLGTYHLATSFAEHFFQNLKKDAKVPMDPAQRERLGSTLRYAALLHDVGHAPFSHTTEDFFTQKKGSNGLPVVWNELCEAIAARNSAEGALFAAQAQKVGASHEIVSSLLLVRNFDEFVQSDKDRALVDPALAARMVIGFPYQRGDLGLSDDELGVRNCLISLLNSKVLDVDRLDYMGRDTQMSGYVNAPLDLDLLARSITAVRVDGMLTTAFRHEALSVFALMFQAKTSHDTWVLANPAGPYEAALLEHCIRKCYGDDLETLFAPEALGSNGVTVGGREYRFLSDADIWADLKAMKDEECDELLTRENGKRKVAAWRSFYEYRHLFCQPGRGDEVYAYMKPLLKYLKEQRIFAFTPEVYEEITKLSDPKLTHPAKCLHDFLTAHTGPDQYSVVLLERSHMQTVTNKIDPAKIYILFPCKSTGGLAYSTFAELTDTVLSDQGKHDYFYLFRVGGLGSKQLPKLQKALLAAVRDARKQGILS